jgi:hypothetical protein
MLRALWNTGLRRIFLTKRKAEGIYRQEYKGEKFIICIRKLILLGR